MKINCIENKLFLWGFFLLLLMNCKEEKGQDKHPDIPEFPATTNPKIMIKPVLNNVNEILFNDSVLVCKHIDSISIYSATSEKRKTIKSKVFAYGNGIFIIENKDGEYEALNDITLQKQNIKTINEAGKYQKMNDSLSKIFTKKSEYEISQLADSLFINYFALKYHLPKDKIPFTRSLRKKDFYVKTEQDEFLLIDAPYSLEKFIDPLIKPVSKQMAPKFKRNFQFFKNYSHKDSFFKEYDYALKSKDWVSLGGGNHYIPSLPFMAEAGYYYLDVFFNNEKGKCKMIRGNHPSLHTIPTKIKNKGYFIDNEQIYRISLK